MLAVIVPLAIHNYEPYTKPSVTLLTYNVANV